jgi:hypothetical protein
MPKVVIPREPDARALEATARALDDAWTNFMLVSENEDEHFADVEALIKALRQCLDGVRRVRLSTLSDGTKRAHCACGWRDGEAWVNTEGALCAFGAHDCLEPQEAPGETEQPAGQPDTAPPRPAALRPAETRADGTETTARRA